MARKPRHDARQHEFFPAPVPAAADLPAAKPSRPSRPRPASPARPAASLPEPIVEREDIGTRFARLAPAEMKALLAELPEEALARLTFAAIGLLHRRLSRARQAKGNRHLSKLEGAVREMVSQIADEEDEYD